MFELTRRSLDDQIRKLTNYLNNLLGLNIVNSPIFDIDALTGLGFAIGVLVARAEKDPELARRLKGCSTPLQGVSNNESG